jgi:hypothetical protein
MITKNAAKVRFVVRPRLTGAKGWLALREDLLVGEGGSAEELRALKLRFASIQVWFSDLDDFDSRSPARIIALRAVGSSHGDPAYLRWAFRSLGLLCRYGTKRAEAMSWELYYDAFLKAEREHDWLKEEAFRFIEGMLSPEGVSRLLYPLVRDFYARFDADKYLVTRNLERIAYRYSKVLPYTGYFHETRDKARVVEDFVEEHPYIRYYGSGGDSGEDEEVAKLLDSLYRKGDIEKPICLFRAASPLTLNKSFNVFVGKNRGALAEALR